MVFISFSVQAKTQNYVEFISSSYDQVQLNLTLYDRKIPFLMNVWGNPRNDIEKSLDTGIYNDKSKAAGLGSYHDEYFNILLQSHRSLQAYQTQRFMLQKDIITNEEFFEAYTNQHAETAISVTLSYVVERIATHKSTDVCFYGDVSFQHVFQFAKGCPFCTIRYYTMSSTGHEQGIGLMGERLLKFMQEPLNLEIYSIGNIVIL
jgi:hypothetical protein